MKFIELIEKTSWNKIKAALLYNYPDTRTSLGDYEKVFNKLYKMHPSSSKIWISLHETYDESVDDKPFIEVMGNYGPLNSEMGNSEDLNNERYLEHSKTEVEYALDLSPWDEWLAMKIDKTTLEKYSYPDIISHCLMEMTFISFDEESILKEKQSLQRDLDKLKKIDIDEEYFEE